MFYIVEHKRMEVNPNSLFYRKTFHGFLIFRIKVSQTDILVYSKALPIFVAANQPPSIRGFVTCHCCAVFRSVDMRKKPSYFWHKKTLENQGF